ncbi:EF-hand domain-containing protein [Sphingobium sufflavum]|uniref:EF-hand domain-containing protein n=1 Tax=Sphingobium sufflavum TaxID=1129547 RepID=UPI001F1F10C4|nr:EF-hand domain-containing protein [Sphingobium sufflavum]MCE7798789.1 EF-hand domain-containing protein [Sphingobium sufflavum]
MNYAVPVLIAAAVSAIALPAQAQQEGATRARALEQADTRFAGLDADKDGVVTPAEVEASLARRAEESGRPVSPERAKGMFSGMDLDKDGKVTSQEARTAAGNRFDAADANKNGVIDPGEGQERQRGGN